VIAEVVKLAVEQDSSLGGGIGVTFSGFADLLPGHRIAYVYWLSLGGMVLVVAVSYAIMRSRVGLGFTAIRDDVTAAGSLGVRVTRSKRLVFVVAAMGSGLAGAMITVNTLRVQPESIFSLNYTAFMIFMVVIGGLGSMEGPILGAVVFFVLQQWLSDLGAWYLVILGTLAIVVTLVLPRGLWGLLSAQGRIRLFPVGYRFVIPEISATDQAAPDQAAPDAPPLDDLPDTATLHRQETLDGHPRASGRLP
jgi:branched-chain amino acid transport system permease protein